ncbi:quaternary amine ABC transporter ATP-binding protein [Candidatus Poriferisodalis sp.]|uniref:quaternary amine ABC transporter ATP-binding protein n=1 Tax=Candidatus Poriferisodalis sp. TaxID=3101277 RepID=UPI003B51E582
MSDDAANGAGGGDEIIRLNDVYKIFGPQPRGRAFELARSGVPKNDVQRLSGHVVGLTDVNFSVNRGEIFVVMGLSGSGKSTAIRMVNKLYDVTHGEVLVDGTDVQKLEGTDLQQFRREKMGMVFQHFALFPHRSVIDNVGYGLKVQGMGRDERNQASLQALALVGLAAFAEHRPAQLSGGMQQRVGLARALASDPDILLMDEAFSALDPLIRRQMQDEMMDIQSRVHKTILFITHDLNEALRIGDRVCIMKDGAVVQIGSPEEILTEPATGYVAEFIQDVDQGRVIQAHEVMSEPRPIPPDMSLSDALTLCQDIAGRFCCDADGRPVSLLTAADGLRARSMGSNDLSKALRSDFDKCSPDSTLNELYAAAGRGLSIAVVDNDGKLIGNLDPRLIMEEMGRVEQLIEDFEREVFM